MFACVSASVRSFVLLNYVMFVHSFGLSSVRLANRSVVFRSFVAFVLPVVRSLVMLVPAFLPVLDC